MKSTRSRHLRECLAKLAKNDPATTAVILSGFAIGKEHEKIAKLAKSLVGNTHVKVLCLDDCGITSKGAQLLAYALAKNRGLDHVWLNNNKIGSSGAEALASSLKWNRTLLTIALSNNSIGNHGGKALVEALRQSHSLTNIFVGGNRMSGRIEDEINRSCSGGEDSHGGGNATDEADAGTVAGSIASKNYASRTLESIKEVDWENDSDDDSLAPSSHPDDEPADMDFACFYQKKKESKLSKLKAIVGRMKRKKVKPDLQ